MKLSILLFAIASSCSADIEKGNFTEEKVDSSILNQKVLDSTLEAKAIVDTYVHYRERAFDNVFFGEDCNKISKLYSLSLNDRLFVVDEKICDDVYGLISINMKSQSSLTKQQLQSQLSELFSLFEMKYGVFTSIEKEEIPTGLFKGGLRNDSIELVTTPKDLGNIYWKKIWTGSQKEICIGYKIDYQSPRNNYEAAFPIRCYRLVFRYTSTLLNHKIEGLKREREEAIQEGDKERKKARRERDSERL